MARPPSPTGSSIEPASPRPYLDPNLPGNGENYDWLQMPVTGLDDINFDSIGGESSLNLGLSENTFGNNSTADLDLFGPLNLGQPWNTNESHYDTNNNMNGIENTTMDEGYLNTREEQSNEISQSPSSTRRSPSRNNSRPVNVGTRNNSRHPSVTSGLQTNNVPNRIQSGVAQHQQWASPFNNPGAMAQPGPNNPSAVGTLLSDGRWRMPDGSIVAVPPPIDPTEVGTLLSDGSWRMPDGTIARHQPFPNHFPPLTPFMNPYMAGGPAAYPPYHPYWPPHPQMPATPSHPAMQFGYPPQVWQQSMQVEPESYASVPGTLDGNATPRSTRGRSRRSSDVSLKTPVSYSEETYSPRKPPASSQLAPMKPQKDAKRPYIRINASTRGIGPRSARIQTYVPEDYYEDIGTPFNAWGPFRYDGVELSTVPLSVRQIKTFVSEHPIADTAPKTHNSGSNQGKMTLWIQRAPPDAARRYASEAASRCMFECCPSAERLIKHGHVRVVFDERYTNHGSRADPYRFAGCVHLFCMERFLNFPKLCMQRNVVVRAENRRMVREVDGKNKMALGMKAGQDKFLVDFLRICRAGNVEEFRNRFPYYPTTREDRENFAEKYKFTLGYQIQMSIRANTAKTTAVFSVHMGNLEIIAAEREEKYKTQVAKRQAKRAARKSANTPELYPFEMDESAADSDAMVLQQLLAEPQPTDFPGNVSQQIEQRRRSPRNQQLASEEEDGDRPAKRRRI